MLVSTPNGVVSCDLHFGPTQYKSFLFSILHCYGLGRVFHLARTKMNHKNEQQTKNLLLIRFSIAHALYYFLEHYFAKKSNSGRPEAIPRESFNVTFTN